MKSDTWGCLLYFVETSRLCLQSDNNNGHINEDRRVFGGYLERNSLNIYRSKKILLTNVTEGNKRHIS
jgi:hypothetical protein